MYCLLQKSRRPLLCNHLNREGHTREMKGSRGGLRRAWRGKCFRTRRPQSPSCGPGVSYHFPWTATVEMPCCSGRTPRKSHIFLHGIPARQLGTFLYKLDHAVIFITVLHLLASRARDTSTRGCAVCFFCHPSLKGARSPSDRGSWRRPFCLRIRTSVRYCLTSSSPQSLGEEVTWSGAET